MAPWIPSWRLLGYGLYLALYFFACDAINDYPAENLRSVVFKLLPGSHLIFVILSSDITAKGYSRYKWNIMIGLVFCMAGDAMLVWRITLFIPGLLFFAIGQFMYIRAFRLTPFGGGPTLVSVLIIVGLVILIVTPNIPSPMYWLVLFYITLIFTMFWRSIVCYQTWPSRGTFCACLGALSFSVSDFMIGYDKFQRPIDGAPFYVMLTYFLAQMLITISVACYEERPSFGKHKLN